MRATTREPTFPCKVLTISFRFYLGYDAYVAVVVAAAAAAALALQQTNIVHSFSTLFKFHINGMLWLLESYVFLPLFAFIDKAQVVESFQSETRCARYHMSIITL